MKRGDIFLLLFVIILATSFVFIYQNLESLECYVEYSYGDIMSDIEYEFEPEGSVYGKTKIFRFIISSSKSTIEYYGMEITDRKGETLYLENLTDSEGGSISFSLEADENETLSVRRFFKKKCYPEIEL